MLLEVCIFKTELAFYYLSLPIHRLINQTILSQDSGQTHFVPGSEHILLRSWQLTRHFSCYFLFMIFSKTWKRDNYLWFFFQGGVEKELKWGGVGMGDRRITSSRPVWPILKNLRKIWLHSKILSTKGKKGKERKGERKEGKKHLLRDKMLAPNLNPQLSSS